MFKQFVERSPQFKPALTLRSGHIQTISAALFYQPPYFKPTRRLKIEVSPTTTIMCDYNRSSYTKKHDACAILVHGLGADSQVNYLTSTARKLVHEGIDTLRINIRNCGNTLHLTDTLFSVGLTDDLRATIEYAHEVLGYTKIVLTGFSMGGNMVLKMMGEYGSSAPSYLKGACTISAPLEMSNCSQQMLRWQNRMYDRHYLKILSHGYRQRKRYWPELDVDLLKQVKSLYDMERFIVAPSFDYQDMDRFYYDCSSLYHLEHIQLPTLIIHAEDDPVIPLLSPTEYKQLHNPNIHYWVTKHGGHVGFINQAKYTQQDRDKFWAENRMVDFVKLCEQ